MSKCKEEKTGYVRTGSQWKDKIITFFETADAWGVFIMGSTFVLMIGSAYLIYILKGDITQ
ncbi:MAG: hypothetical protein AAF575_04920 [Bacteroidota bacterium]